jgi:hypothetical protein
MKEYIDTLGGWMMAVGYPAAGLFMIIFAGRIKDVKRMRQAYLYGMMFLFSGISRGLIQYGLNDSWANAILKFISGFESIIGFIYMRVIAIQMMTTQTIENVSSKIDDAKERLEQTRKETQEAVEKLTSINENLNISNPRNRK